MTPATRFSRRAFLACAAGGAAAAIAQPAPATTRSSTTVAQLIDTSPEHQELSRNYATGIRLAWAGLSKPGGPLSRCTLTTIQTDGTDDGVRAALLRLRDDRSVVALVGNVGDQLAVRTVAACRALDLHIAHVAPWMPDPRFDADPAVASLFASRDTQLRQALESVRGMGLDDLDVMFTSESQRDFYAASVSASAAAAKLRIALRAPDKGQAVASVAMKLPNRKGAVLFMGDTVDLALVARAMASAGDRRMIFSLGSVDHPTLVQLGGARGGALVLTQVVPNPRSSTLACARAYREALKELFDEDPSPVSFAGYLAGRYAAVLLGKSGALPTRESVLETLRNRPAADLQGFPVDFSRGPRGSGYVTQTLLTADGRLVG